VRRSRGSVPGVGRRIGTAILAALGLPCVAGAATAQTSDGRAALEPAFLRWTPEPIQLDGALDEPAWRTADSLSDFTQLDPDEGQPATERTVVRFLGTAAGLYIGLVAHDSVPARMGRAQLNRDADLSSDDSFSILLDPQRDRRTGYLFSINPNGAMFDAEIQGPDDTNSDWDGHWDARARLTHGGWTAEILLPWQTLRYGKNGAAWGLNLERFIRRKNEVALWRGWRRHQGLLFQEAQGSLVGLDSLPARPRAEVRPYLVMAQSQAERDFGEDGRSRILETGARDVRIGGDVKLAVTPTLTLDLTLSSDFAQVEVDRQVVNLTRFPLQFPEKRPFFLENSGIFGMGEPGEVELFYSRRIGLAENGTPIPLAAGARLHGRSGEYRLGVVAVRTGDNEDATDLVARITRDVLSRGRVGAMVTSRNLPDQSTDWSAGLDIQLPLLVGGQDLVASGYAARSGRRTDAAAAWGLSVDYPNDWSDSYLGVSHVGEGFDPALGFVRENGIRRYIGGLQFFPRPRGLGIRRLNLKLLQWEVANDLDGERAYAEYEIRPIGVEFKSGAAVELNLQRSVDVPQERVEIFPGSFIAAGDYRYDRVQARYFSSGVGPLAYDVSASTGGFYDGTSMELEGSVELRSAPHVVTFLDYAIHDVRRPESAFTAQVARLGIDLAVSPRFGGSLLTQWDNESSQLTVNARIHWTPQPGTDAYLVWNSAWPTGIEGGIPWRRPQRGVLIGKLVHYFRL
jgi:hypothetical protein